MPMFTVCLILSSAGYGQTSHSVSPVPAGWWWWEGGRLNRVAQNSVELAGASVLWQQQNSNYAECTATTTTTTTTMMTATKILTRQHETSPIARPENSLELCGHECTLVVSKNSLSLCGYQCSCMAAKEFVQEGGFAPKLLLCCELCGIERALVASKTVWNYAGAKELYACTTVWNYAGVSVFQQWMQNKFELFFHDCKHFFCRWECTWCLHKGLELCGSESWSMRFSFSVNHSRADLSWRSIQYWCGTLQTGTASPVCTIPGADPGFRDLIKASSHRAQLRAENHARISTLPQTGTRNCLVTHLVCTVPLWLNDVKNLNYAHSWKNHQIRARCEQA